jgi:hypothetical protein
MQLRLVPENSGVVLIVVLFYSWGESASATSVGLHLVMNDGNSEGLFHGAFMVATF